MRRYGSVTNRLLIGCDTVLDVVELLSLKSLEEQRVERWIFSFFRSEAFPSHSPFLYAYFRPGTVGYEKH